MRPERGDLSIQEGRETKGTRHLYRPVAAINRPARPSHYAPAARIAPARFPGQRPRSANPSLPQARAATSAAQRHERYRRSDETASCLGDPGDLDTIRCPFCGTLELENSATRHRSGVLSYENENAPMTEIYYDYLDDAPEPTYALSHRFGYPKEYDPEEPHDQGESTCVCGWTLGHSPTPPCYFHAPALRGIQRISYLFLYTHLADLDGSDDLEASVHGHDQHPNERAIPDAEEDRCARLGVPYQEPDYQELDELVDDLTVQIRQEVAWRRALTQRESRTHRELSRASEGRPVSARAARENHGGIVRLGCPERELDGVTARKP